jgi:hypothetical protein
MGHCQREAGQPTPGLTANTGLHGTTSPPSSPLPAAAVSPPPPRRTPTPPTSPGRPSPPDFSPLPLVPDCSPSSTGPPPVPPPAPDRSSSPSSGPDSELSDSGASLIQECNWCHRFAHIGRFWGACRSCRSRRPFPARLAARRNKHLLPPSPELELRRQQAEIDRERPRGPRMVDWVEMRPGAAPVLRCVLVPPGSVFTPPSPDLPPIPPPTALPRRSTRRTAASDPQPSSLPAAPTRGRGRRVSGRR